MRSIRLSPAGIRCAFAVAFSAYVLVGVFSTTGIAGQARTVAAGVYTADQATAGKQLYTGMCAACHGEMMEGIIGPPLVGNDFAASGCVNAPSGIRVSPPRSPSPFVPGVRRS